MTRTSSACAMTVGLLFLIISFAPLSESEYDVGWQEAILAEDYGLHSVYSPASATDGEGNVMAVWLQSNGSGRSVFASQYTAGGVWSEAELIEDSNEDVISPLIAMSKEGHAVVVWRQTNETTAMWDIWGNVYVEGTGWTGAKPVAANGSYNDAHCDLTIDSSGNAAVVWARLTSPTEVLMSRREAGSSWSAAVPIDESGTADAMYPSIGVDGTDSLLVTWIQEEMSVFSVWAKRYDSTEGWNAPEKLADSGDSGHTVLSVSEGGDAICAWTDLNGTTSLYDVYSCIYRLDYGWSNLIMSGHSSSAHHKNPDVAIGRDGDAILAWEAVDIGSDYVYCRSYGSGTGWGDDRLLATSPWSVAEVNPPDPSVAMNGYGDMLCIFRHYDGQMDTLRGTSCNFGGEWMPSTMISKELIEGIGMYFALTINEDGSGLAVWDQSDSATASIWSAEYVAPDVTPPTIVIDSPEDGSTVDSNVVTVTGVTEPGALLIVNGIVVAVEDNGSFECNILLDEGENIITAVATDEASNSASTSVTVTYEVPEDTVQEELDDVNKELNETKAELNETIADLEEANSELDDVNDQLEEAGESLDDAERRIDSLAAQMMALMALTAVFVILSIVMTALYFSLRKAMGSSEKKPEEPEVLPPPE